MSKIPLQDQPRYITDEEVQVAKNVRAATWVDVAGVINFLNFSCRTISPYTRWGSGIAATVDTVIPVSLPTYSTRKLVVLVGIRPVEGAVGPHNVTFSSSSGGSTILSYMEMGVPASGYSTNSEAQVEYVFAQVEVTADTRENITVTGTVSSLIDGYGIWELPPIDGGANHMAGPGITPLLSSIEDSISGVIDPNDFMGDAEPDATVLAAVQASALTGWTRNRRHLYTLNVHQTWETPGSAANTWFSLPLGGIYIPPYAYSRAQETAGKRIIRATVHAFGPGGGVGEWRIETSIGNFSGTTYDGALGPLYSGWQPFERATGAYDETLDGIRAEVGLAGEWIHIGLRTTGAGQASITGVSIWEEEP